MTGKAATKVVSYDPRRTLPLRVEAARQLRRRRTVAAFTVLLALPCILAGALEAGGPPHQIRDRALVSLATAGGLNFVAFSLYVSAAFLLVLAVALFCGDTVSAEASWSSLRYLLAAPVPRARLLRQKLAVALAYSAVAVTSLPVMALLVGTLAFGWHPLRLPGSGVQLPASTALGHLAIALGYILVTELVVAALAFLLSVSTDSPLGAVGGAVALIIVSSILDSVTALGSWRQLLPTHWQFAWLAAISAPPRWNGMVEGASVSVSYAVILLALAFRKFQSRDILS